MGSDDAEDEVHSSSSDSEGGEDLENTESSPVRLPRGRLSVKAAFGSRADSSSDGEHRASVDDDIEGDTSSLPRRHNEVDCALVLPQASSAQVEPKQSHGERTGMICDTG